MGSCLDPNATTTTAAPTPAPPSPSPSPPSPSPSPPPPSGSCASMPSFMGGNRIVGGEEAPSMIPWQVATVPNGCGGTVIDACTILSAAHCGLSTSTSIRAGSLQRNSGGQVRSVSQVISNNQYPYNSQTLNNDWVILKLSSPLELNNDVQPACLPSSDYLPVTATEEQCYTSGWGTLQSGGGSLPTILRYVQVPAITNAQCNNAYGGSITNSMICAGYPGEGGNAIIAGVVSWGFGCADANYPGVYARTSLVV